MAAKRDQKDRKRQGGKPVTRRDFATLFVSQTRYVTFGLPIEVTADINARAELSVEPVLERN